MGYQVTFPHEMEVARQGMAAGKGDDRTGQATEIIKGGYGVFNVSPLTANLKGETPKIVMAGGVGAGQFIGVARDSVHQFTLDVLVPQGTLETTDMGDYLVGSAVTYRREGYIWVAVNQAIDPTKPVHLITVGAERGKFRADATGFTTVDLSTNAKWVGISTNLKYAQLYLIGNTQPM
jgi:hypothetical protein